MVVPIHGPIAAVAVVSSSAAASVASVASASSASAMISSLSSPCCCAVAASASAATRTTAMATVAALERVLTIVGRGGGAGGGSEAAVLEAAGRGAAVAAAMGVAAEAALRLRGGALRGGGRGGSAASPTEAVVVVQSKDVGGGRNDDGTSKVLGLPPRARAVFSMASAMALHYLAYSLARPATLALFTSSRTGYAGIPAAYPFAMGFVSPTSLVLLLLYAKVLDARGPRAALRISSLGCASVLAAASCLVAYLEAVGAHLSALPFVQAVVGALFVFRESYVQLLTSQHWSYMSSVLTPAQSSVWFAPISGLTSATSAIAGMGVSYLVERLGLCGVMGTAAATLALSSLLTERAYAISERFGFNPADEHRSSGSGHGGKAAAAATTATTATQENVSEPGMVKKASILFARVPVLKALFVEILACQGVSTILNVCYVSKLSQAIPDDKERAGWSGKFFAIINVVSGFMQFVILPPLMKFVEPSALWRIMPMIVMAFTTTLSFLKSDPSLNMVAGTFLIMKAMEFSVRRMLDELVYVPLDFESRFVGKEVIGVFGYRFGKSGMSLAVSALTSSNLFGTDNGLVGFGLRQLTMLSSLACAVWLRCTWVLSRLVLTRAEAEEAYRKKRGLASVSSSSSTPVDGGGAKGGGGGGGGGAKGRR